MLLNKAADEFTESLFVESGVVFTPRPTKFERVVGAGGAAQAEPSKANRIFSATTHNSQPACGIKNCHSPFEVSAIVPA